MVKKILIIAGLYLMMLPAINSMAFAGTVSGSVNVQKAKYLNQVVVYIRKADGNFQPKKNSSSMDQRNLKFIPKVLPILVGTTVIFKNSDNVKHNVFSPDVEPYDIGTWGPGVNKPHTFTKPGIYTQLCNVHHEMEAFILVLQNPYFAQVAKDGSYKITGVPAGEYELKAWHYNRKAKSQKIKVGSGTLTANFEL